MKKMAIRIMILLLCAVMLLGLVMPALATELPAADAKLHRIRTAEDLKEIAEDPTGHYILENDIDMTGIEWKPIDFAGVFDGMGHALLNLSLTQPGDAVETAYDGNRKSYDCKYVGLFSTLKNAEVKNLKLMGVEGYVETDEPCFMGSIAGYVYKSTITDCVVYGTMEMRAHNQMFGLGGIAGYGVGSIDKCEVDLVMILTDTNQETLDEQFLGGAFSTGYMDVRDSEIKLNAFASEYGYAHTGGIVGMLMQYPIGEGKRLEMMRNSVSGSITFFECNADRRAYCAPFAGEVLAVSYNISENLQFFKRNELWKYDQELRPCMCENPETVDEVVRGKCAKYGYTETKCLSCEFVSVHSYTLFEHDVSKWELLDPPTPKSEGLSEGTCDLCAAVVYRKEPVLEVEPEPETQPTEATQPVEQEVLVVQGEDQGITSGLFLVLIIATLVLTAAGILVARMSRKKF